MKISQLGTVTEIVESASMDVSYAYEDLIFLEHNGFLLQFTDRDQEVLVHINKEMSSSALAEPLALLQKKAEERTMVFSMGDYFRISQLEEDCIHIEFSKQSKVKKGNTSPQKRGNGAGSRRWGSTVAHQM